MTKKSNNNGSKPIACRICGCTEMDACKHPEHGSCWWEEFDLCSHCKFWPGESKRFSQIIDEKIDGSFTSNPKNPMSGDARPLAHALMGKDSSKHFLTSNKTNMPKKVETALKIVPLTCILIGRSNPRKQFDEDAIQEIAASIKEKGVIQPILVRPVGDDLYELVCGERRYRGSVIAERPDIPIYIREMTDDEALILQITENLQRKDVHPMEEAYSIAQLMEKYTLAETCAHFGKKEYFINQRMKLNDLTPNWQRLFYNNAVHVIMALKIAALPIDIQLRILADNNITKENIEKKQRLEINDYTIRQYNGSLKKAPFSLEDKTLDKKAGACNGCRYNTAVANLFPEDVKNPVCSNVSCFKNKCDIFFERELKAALAEPAIIFITESSYSVDSKIEARLKKESHVVLKNHNDFSIVSIDDEEPDYHEYKEDSDFEEGDDEEDIKADFEKLVLRYQDQKHACEKKIATGKYIKAFVIDGNNKGQYKYIQLNKKATDKGAKKAVDSGDASLEDIEAELGRLKSKEIRNKELDAEKVHVRIIGTLKEHKEITALPSAATETDKLLLRFLIMDYISYNNRDVIKKITGMVAGRSADKGDKYYEQLQKLEDQHFIFIVRNIFFDRYNNSLPPHNDAYMLRRFAEDLGTVPVEAFEIEQKEKAEKRQKKLAERLADLAAQKKELRAVEKKPAPKKSAKK